MNNVVGPKNRNFLLHVTDSRTNDKWLVDGGALLSIIPPTSRQLRQGPNGVELRAANGSKIPCYGTAYRTITIGKQNFSFDFTVAAVSQRILGADFLANFYLAPNHRDAELINLQDYSTLPAQHAKGVKSTPINFVSQMDDPFYKLLDSYPEILTPTFTLKEPSHGVKHYIPTNGPPVQSRSRRLDPEKLAVAKAELGKLEELGICYRGRSEWASPLLVTTKPCGGWRVCGDYRRLNAMTTDDKYPVRTLQDFTSELHGKKFFSKIDLLKGYHQIPVSDGDIPKTAVITPFGLYIFPRTPFGLKNAGQDFQRLMDEILGDLPRVFVYIDDILIASETLEQHLADLKAVFDLLAANGLVIQRPKCVLGKSQLEFLGYQVDESGISPLPDRVVAIRATKPPTNIKELQRFLGMVGYYRRFIPNAAQHLFHLFEALKGPKASKPKVLNWTPDRQKSFDATKEALAAATLLFHPRPGAQLALTTDASNMAIGGVLEQRGPNGWEPLAFYSSKLEPNQQQWPPYDRELLAAFKGTRHFRSWVEGRPFTLYTDHQSLVPSMHKKTDPQTLRQTYQLGCISEFTTDIRYVEGKANLVADALSRPNDETPDVSTVSQASSQTTQEENRPGQTATSIPDPLPTTSSTVSAAKASDDRAATLPIFSPVQPVTTAVTATANKAASAAKATAAASDLNCIVAAVGDLGVDWELIAGQTPLDPEFQRLRNDMRSGLNLKSIHIGNKQLIVDTSNGTPRPYIPYESRRKIFDSFHGLGHPGIARTRQMICSKVVWPSIREDVSRWARECLDCQRSKVTKNIVPPIGEFLVPNKRFEHINIDLVTMPSSNGFKYLFTAVDRFTRWPVAIPIVDMSTQSVVDALSFGWIQHFGVPTTLTSDRGTQFSSVMFQQLTRIWGITHNMTAPYHPEANGLVERFHRRLKEALIALGNDETNNWFWKLPMVMLAIRTTLKPDVGASPADLVYGEGLAVPGEVLPSVPASDPQLLRQRRAALTDLQLEVSRLQPTQTSAHRRPLVHMPEELNNCTYVFVRRGTGGVHPCLAAPYLGPYRVISRNSVNFKIAIPGRAVETVAISRIKPAYCSIEDAEDAAPAARRPPPAARRPPPDSPPPRRRTRDSQSPPIRRRVPLGRARRLPSDDEDEHPPPLEDPLEYPLDHDVPVDDAPVWAPPPWFDPDEVVDWGEQPEAGSPAASPQHSPAASRRSASPPAPQQELFPDPPPPPPPRTTAARRRRDGRGRAKKRFGNPNWVKGGSFAGANHGRPRPDVTAILAHLGLPICSPPSPQSHQCNSGCDSDNSPRL